MLRIIALTLSSGILAVGVAANAAGPAASPQPTAAQGQRVFIRCASCHAIGPAGGSKIGPNLQGVVGRKGGSVPGYAYSPAMKAKAPTWDEATLDRWLLRPSAVVPGTSMAFAGLTKPDDRKALIAYMKSKGK